MATLQNIGKLKYRGKDGQWHPLPVVVQEANCNLSTISGKGAPTSATQGKVNQLYRNEDTQKLYICTATAGGYTWAAVVSDTEDAVTYTAQTLTEEQKTQARANIGAGTSNFSGSYNDLSNKPDAVTYTAQTLTEEQKTQARANIGAGTSNFSGSYNDLSNKPDAVTYTAQTLTEEQKTQARANIGAGTSNFSGSYNDLSNKPNIPVATVIDTTLTKSGQAADAKAAGDAIEKKLDKAQGVENAGMILGVDESGNVVPENKPVQALAGDAAPTTATAGVVGQEYYVITDGAVAEMYVCTAAANGTYTWDKVEFGAEIDDTSTEQTKVWSAKKSNQLSKEISNLEGFVLGTANLKSWKEVQELIRAGFAPKILKIGDQLECQRDGVKLTWDIIGLDCDTPVNPGLTHSMTLQLHDGWKSLQFDEAEALYYCETELAAGTYNFTLLAGYDTTYGGGKTYSFTLANAVPAGGVIMFPWGYQMQAAETKINTYASRESTTVIESVSVTEGANGTSLGTADGNSANMNHTQRIRYGSNRYSTSAIRQILNSDAAAGNVWTPQTIYDRPPTWAAKQNGFLAGLDPDFLAVVADVKKRTALNTITDGGGYEDTVEKFFLLSSSEVYAGLENSVNEGSPYPYYSDFSDLSEAGPGEDGNRIKYMDGVAKYWSLRSPNASRAISVRAVNASGKLNSIYAYGAYACAPACTIA